MKKIFRLVRYRRFLFVIFCFFTTTNPLHSQWIQTNGPSGAFVRTIAVSGTNIFAGAYASGVYLSTDNGAIWSAVNTGLTDNYILVLAVSETNLFVGTQFGGVSLSTNNGTSWTAVNSGLTNTSVYALAFLPDGTGGTNLFAGTDGGGIFVSTNNGASWTTRNTGLTYLSVRTFALLGTNLFAGTFGGGVFLSTDNGTNWAAVNTGLTDHRDYTLAVLGTNLFTGTAATGSGIFVSTNNGTSWTAVNTGLTNSEVWSLVVSGANLFAGTSGGVFLSTNNGTSWTAASTGLTNTSVHALAVSGTNLFAGTNGSGVFVGDMTSPLPVEITSFIVKQKQSAADLLWTTATEVNNYGFEVERRIFGEASDPWNTIGFIAGAGTSNSPHEYIYSDNNLSPGKYTYRIKQIDRDGSFKYSGQQEVEIAAPAKFALAPNFPNPFNPSTTFSFNLPMESHVSLIVFDALGRKVSVVLSEELPAGSYSRKWNAADLTTGMYFYRLQAGTFTETKKLLLLK